MYGQVPKFFCWWFECSQSNLGGAYWTSLICVYEVEGSKLETYPKQMWLCKNQLDISWSYSKPRWYTI
jgi:hypothetical protein